jgi:hypothetical protein
MRRETGAQRGPVAVVEDARLTGPATLDLLVESCNGAREVTATVTDPGDACLDVLEVVLDEPLGERELVDVTSGRTVPVVPGYGGG